MPLREYARLHRASVDPVKRILRRPAALACLLVVVMQAFLLVALVRDPGMGEPHHVPLAVAAPGVVAGSLAEEANALPGEPFSAIPLPVTDVADGLVHARSTVEDGSSVAAMVVDLRGARDLLLLNSARDTRLNDSVLARVRSVETSYHRTIDVEYTNGARADKNTAVAASVGPAHAYNVTLAASIVGFLLVLLISLARGPVAPTLRLGVRRVVVVAGLSLVAGLLLVTLPGTSLPGPAMELAALDALSVLVAALSTLALEALAGLAGLAFAAALFFVLATPLLTRTDAYLLPMSWPVLAPWTRTGATLEAVDAVAFFDPSHVVRPVLTLAVWLVVATALLLVAERARARFGVGPTSYPSRGALATISPSPADVVRNGSPRRHHLWRLRVLGAVVPLAVLLGVAVAFVPRAATVVSALPSKASETTCVGTGQVRNVTDLNRVAGKLRGSPEFQGGDVGADVQLQDGRRLWVFGDTLRGDDFDGQRLVRNSMLVFDPDCLKVVLPNDHGALIPDRSDGVGYWPMSIGRTQMPGYDLVSVATQRVRTTGTDAFSFENLGPSIAVFVVPRAGTPQLIAQRDIGPDSADRSRPTWGAAAAVRDGWVFLYGTANPGKAYVFGFSLRVARVRPDDILDASRWRYWSGQAWVADSTKATELIPAQGGVSQTLSVFERDGTWYALSKRDEFLGTDLTIWAAPAPTGPFASARTLAKLPSNAVTGELRYMPLAHPDLLPEKGTMVVSYSRNSTDAGAVEKNPLLYRPEFLRVDLP